MLELSNVSIPNCFETGSQVNILSESKQQSLVLIVSTVHTLIIRILLNAKCEFEFKVSYRETVVRIANEKIITEEKMAVNVKIIKIVLN